MTDFTRLLPQ